MKNTTRIAYLFILAALPSLLIAQTAKITGIITDDAKKTLPFANVSLLKTKDSSLIKGALTDSLGQFEFDKLKKNTYLIAVSFVGFKPHVSKLIAVDSQNITLLPIEMTPLSNLKEVTITTKKPFIERKIDRVVVNPDALISNAGTTALEVLEKAPSIQVDISGSISLRGKKNVVIFIDDKPTYLTGANLANYLRGIPSSTIDVIEIMTNPPAKYDAAGGAGVVNIRLKKSTVKGFNGFLSLAYGQGIYARVNDSYNFNYRVNKVNFFSTIGYNLAQGYQNLTMQRQYFEDNGTLKSAFTQNSLIKKERYIYNLKFGVDYYVSKKATIGFVVNGFYNPQTSNTPNNATSKNGNNLIESTIESYITQNDKWKNINFNVNYNYKISKTQGEISANGDIIYYDLRSNSNLQNNIFYPNTSIINREAVYGNLPATIDIKTAKIDYSKPIQKGGTFEAGIKTSLIKTNNTAEFKNNINDNVRNNLWTNYFLYDENINAAYVNFNKSFKKDYKKIAIQTGLRLENTTTKGHQLGNNILPDTSFTRDYTRLFPTLYVSYKLDTLDKHLLVFSAGRRIERPTYQSLNPFTYPLDKFTLFSGNPFLKPTFTYSVEVAHTYKSFLTTTLLYSYDKDYITEVVENKTNYYNRPGNIDSKTTAGITVDATVTPKKWWSLQLHSEVLNVHYKGILFTEDLNTQRTNWAISGTNLFKINKLWNAELGGFYNSTTTLGQFELIPVWQVRAGVSTKILKDKGTLKLTVTDIFLQPRGGTINNLAHSTASFTSIGDTRMAILVFTYRFTKGQNLKVRTSGGADNEVKRVKTN
jgi:iron complex outermembrane recepter protein